jgi:hypothetical protein
MLAALEHGAAVKARAAAGDEPDGISACVPVDAEECAACRHRHSGMARSPDCGIVNRSPRRPVAFLDKFPQLVEGSEMNLS